MSRLKISISILFILIFFTGFSQSKKIEVGIASYYHDGLSGHKTANGEKYSPVEMTAAHLSLPFNSIVEVKNLQNDKSVIVRINDRGPFVSSRVIDLSRAAANALDFIERGLVKVEIKILRRGSAADTNSRDSLLFSGLKNIFRDKKANQKMSIVANKPIANLPKTKIDTINTIRGNKIYGIQIGSFKSKENMLRTSERLKNDFIEEFNIQEINKGNILFYRMILGEFSNIKDAEKLRSKIRKEFPGCFVISY